MSSHRSDAPCIGQHPNTEPDDLPDADVGYLCIDCFKRLRSQLTMLPAVATWLEVNIGASGVAHGDRVSGSRDDPIPLRLDITDLIGPVAPSMPAPQRNPDNTLTIEALDQLGEPSIYDELRAWAAFVEQESGMAWDDRRTLTGAVTYLASHLTWICDQPWVDEFAGKITDLHRQAHHRVPWREVVRHDRDETCSHCGVRALVIHRTEEIRRCEKYLGGCGRSEHVMDRWRRTA